MDVRIDEAGYHEAPAGVFYCRSGTDEWLDPGRVTNVNEHSVTHGERLSHLVVIGGVDSRIGQHQIRGLRRRVRGSRRERSKRNRHSHESARRTARHLPDST